MTLFNFKHFKILNYPSHKIFHTRFDSLAFGENDVDILTTKPIIVHLVYGGP